jgi:predicted nucleic acid-binding protein
VRLFDCTVRIAHVRVVDYVIAATAEIQGAELLTLDVEHFPMVPGLEPAFR